MHAQLRTIATAVVAAVIGTTLTAGVVLAAVQAGTEPQCVGTSCIENHELADRAVTAEKLASGDLGNVIEDGGFERTPSNQLPISRSWPVRSGSPTWQIAGGRTDCFQGTRCATRAGDGTNSTARLGNAAVLDARLGDQVRFSGALRSTSGANGTARVVVEWLDSSGAVVGSGQALRPAGTAWLVVSGSATAPRGTVRARAGVEVVLHGAGSWYADALTLRRILPGTELQTNAVDGSTIADGSVGQLDIGANAVTGGRVQDGSLSLADFLLSSVDSRYATKASLQGGTVNTAGNPVSWGRLLGVPGGFGDGIDNTLDNGREGRKADTGGLCTDFCLEGEMSLPAGTFLVSARLELHQMEVHYLVVDCRLQFGGRVDTVYAHLHEDSEDMPVTMTLMAKQTSTGTVQVRCRDHGQGSVEGKNLVITAIPLQSFIPVAVS